METLETQEIGMGGKQATKSLSEQGPANHGAAAAGNACHWLDGGPLSAQYCPKNVLYWYLQYRNYSHWVA